MKLVLISFAIVFVQIARAHDEQPGRPGGPHRERPHEREPGWERPREDSDWVGRPGRRPPPPPPGRDGHRPPPPPPPPAPEVTCPPEIQTVGNVSLSSLDDTWYEVFTSVRAPPRPAVCVTYKISSDASNRSLVDVTSFDPVENATKEIQYLLSDSTKSGQFILQRNGSSKSHIVNVLDYDEDNFIVLYSCVQEEDSYGGRGRPRPRAKVVLKILATDREIGFATLQGVMIRLESMPGLRGVPIEPVVQVGCPSVDEEDADETSTPSFETTPLWNGTTPDFNGNTTGSTPDFNVSTTETPSGWNISTTETPNWNVTTTNGTTPSFENMTTPITMVNATTNAPLDVTTPLMTGNATTPSSEFGSTNSSGTAESSGDGSTTPAGISIAPIALF